MSAAVHANEIIKTYAGLGLPAWGVKSPRSVRGLPQPALALDRVSFDVPAGEIFGLVGPAGSGKTTLIRLLAALLPTDSGDLRVFGFDPLRQRAQVHRLINPVSVEASFFKGLSALDNLVNILSPFRLPGNDARGQIADLLARLGLDEDSQSHPMETLGREQQPLVFIARAVLSRPRLLLLDEPFTGLDLFSRYRVREVLRDLRDQHDVTILFTTRDHMEAENLADRFAVLSNGRLAAIETPQASAYPIWPAPADCCSHALDKMSV